MELRQIIVGSLVLLTTAVGCAAGDPEEDATDATSDALIGGNTTLERPEIGRFYHGQGLCTGTLVRPDVVVTASHCFPLANDQDVTKDSVSWRFIVTTADKVNHTYKVDRVHSILQGSDLGSGNGWRAQDVALVHLATDVPATIARPAVLASRWTLPGAKVALFGFGCTDASTHEGVGTKRKIEESWTIGQWLGFTSSQALCGGDSGGPVLDVANNAVMGTNSGGGDADFFGNVPKNRAAIDAMIAHWGS